MHGGGVAYIAYRKFGAIMGQGVGLQGQSYAIPTMQGGVENGIKPEEVPESAILQRYQLAFKNRGSYLSLTNTSCSPVIGGRATPD